ncbi:DeoR/GlpR family DNA-binding transcription regulator [Paenibacillus sp. DMB20]|uniref:DeoR/GlpR family DNA-binding transcription regulator n=1 Tax=Paenibacillus sp. DMB20 TaxID=1642570 RepID=UPI000ADD37EF|nr:DeoR/GlpR family DNA-binding transcription regulator [Paenibacillus sp. DMB20]
MSVLAVERKTAILDQLQASGKVNASELARQLDVSMETIRRDLDVLEKEGLLKRVHGGAVKINFQLGEPPFYQRKQVNLEEKRKVAFRAAQLVKDGDTIAMSGGTTILAMAQEIRGVSKVTVITNSVPTAKALMDSLNQGLFHGKVILLGGELNAEQYSANGTVCEKMMELFCVNKAFISPGGISLSGITEYAMEDSGISGKMLLAAKEKNNSSGSFQDRGRGSMQSHIVETNRRRRLRPVCAAVVEALSGKHRLALAGRRRIRTLTK